MGVCESKACAHWRRLSGVRAKLFLVTSPCAAACTIFMDGCYQSLSLAMREHTILTGVGRLVRSVGNTALQAGRKMIFLPRVVQMVASSALGRHSQASARSEFMADVPRPRLTARGLGAGAGSPEVVLVHGSSSALTRSRGETEHSWIVCAACNGIAN